MSSEQYKHIDFDAINDIADGDQEFIREIIENFLSTVAEGVQKLNEALVSEDEVKLVFFAHKLKGTFGFVGAGSLHQLASALEASPADKVLVQTNVAAINELLPLVSAELLHLMEQQ